MSYAEWTRWLLFRKEHGPMTDERRFDRPAAVLAQLYHQIHFKNPGTVADFMPWPKQPESSIDDIARELGAFVRKR